MVFPYCKIIFLFIVSLSFVKPLKIPIWNHIRNITNITDNLNDQEINDINSYIFDPKTGAELYLFNNRQNLFLKDGAFNKIKNNTLNLTDLQPYLIKITDTENTYYFCSSSSKELIKFNESDLIKIPNLEIMDTLYLEKNFSLKCFYDIHHIDSKDREAIMVAYIGTQYLQFLDPRNDNYVYVFPFRYNENDLYPREIISIDEFIYTDTDSEHHYIVLTSDKSKQIYNENYCNIYLIKKANGNIVPFYNTYFPYFELKNKTEISSKKEENQKRKAYIFSYTSNSSYNDYNFYLLNVENQNSYENRYDGQINAKYYIHFLNEFNILFANFITNTSFLYYLVEDFSLAKIKYIGVADLEFYLLLFNIQENLNEIPYFNYGSYYKGFNDEKLVFFSDNKKITYCPFINIGNTGRNECFYQEYFNFKLENNSYINEKVSSCNKVKMGPYCINNCSVGYEFKNNECSLCELTVDRFINFKAKNCVTECNSNYHQKNRVCYDCDYKVSPNDTATIYYEENCISDCEEIYGIYDEDEKTCISCKNLSLYYSFSEHNCTNRKNCKASAEDINDFFQYCKECSLKDKLYLNYSNYSYCVDECPDTFINSKNSCVLCNEENNTFYLNGSCVSECNETEGYGLYNKVFKNEELNVIFNNSICQYCFEIHYFLRGNYCDISCGSGYLIRDLDNLTCKACGVDNEPKYYVEKVENCYDYCPKGSREVEENVCRYCPEGQYYHNENGVIQCLSKNKCDIIKNHTKNSKDIPYGFQECIICKDDEIIIGDTCSNNCTNENYLYKNNICYKCFCAGNFSCLEKSDQCNCENKNDTHYYGYSCEFYSEVNIIEKEMKIISLNNRLIKTSQNFFTYKFKNGTKLSDNYTFTWRLFIDDKEIEDEKKEYFITSKNEQMFGINKEVFEENKNKKISISLDIGNEEKAKLEDGSHIILLNILEPFEYDIECDKKMNKGGLGLIEMNNNLILEGKNNVESKKDNSKGRYLFQYGLLDIHNEKIPLTNYIEFDSTNLNVICSKGYYINIKNDREEIKNAIKINDNCSPLQLKINDIIDDKNYLMAEKIFLLISNLKNPSDNFEDNMISKLIKYINEIASNSTIINENGYYEEEKNKEKTNITFFEPKTLFSLIYHFNNYIKPYLNEGYINNSLSFFEQIFKQVFIERNGIISKNTLSDSDIISLFRTIDNFYDICIETISYKMQNIHNNIIKILNNLAKYLAYKSYPSQTIRLVGKRISLFSFNLGKHEKKISLPYIYESFDTNIEDLSTYIYNDYYSNENETCQQKKNSIFCLDDYSDLKDKINLLYENSTDTFLNIYLIPELNKSNEKYDENNLDKIIVNKNYTTIIQLFKNESGIIEEIDDKNFSITVDMVFPYGLNLDKKEIQQKKDKEKGIFNKVKNQLDKLKLNITLSPNNSDFTCVTKSYKEKSKNSNGELNTCRTHFDYENNTVRCSCSITSGDEIFVVKDHNLALKFQDIQFPKTYFKMTHKYILFILYSFIFLILIPTIIYLILDISKDSKYIKENQTLKNIENERKVKYNEVKKYYNKGVFGFSIYLTLNKYPYFSVFNNYYSTFPRFIKHLVVSIGLSIGLIAPLVPYLFMTFSERDTFIGQRDIQFTDDRIKSIAPDNYKLYSLAFSFLGLIFGNLFIYIFSKILDYEKQELDIWLKIKSICKDYIYYEIKQEVLLGAIWKKIKLRMFSFYYICGDYILRKKNKKQKNAKLKEYLKHISRNYDEKSRASINMDVDQILPRITIDSNSLNTSKDIKYSSKNKISFEMANKPLLDKDDNDNDSFLLNNSINNKEKKIGKKNIFNKIINSSLSSMDDLNLNICKLDNFMLDNKTKFDKSKRQIERYEKVRNKYIYVHKKVEINEIEIDDKSFDEKDNYCISPQNNYSYLPEDSYTNIKKEKNAQKESSKILFKFIFISAILMIIVILFIIFILYLVKTVLNTFDEFILKAWIIPIIFIITILNFILYYIKMLIGSIVLYHGYHLRKKRCIIKCLFWLFVDKTMIQIYKVKNLISKYKKEFDYL